MDTSSAKYALPVSYQAQVIQPIVSLVRSGEACAVIGVASSGKTNVVQHLLRAEVREHYFQNEAPWTVFLHLNCKPYPHKPPYLFALDALDALQQSIGQLAPALAALAPRVNELWTQALAQPELLSKRNFALALDAFAHAGGKRVALLLDDSDDWLAHAPVVVFDDLRELRNRFKYMLVYVTFTRREPVFLRRDAKDYEELFELLSADGHTIPILPHTRDDSLFSIRRIAARQTPPRVLSDAEAEKLYHWGGGHPGLMRALFFATQNKINLYEPDAQVRLVENPEVEGECQKIWDSLEKAEQVELLRIVQNETPTANGARRLERRGLVLSLRPNQFTFFSPMFEAFVAKRSAKTAPPAAGGALFEFLPNGRDVRVGNRVVTTLSHPEYELLRFLYSKRLQIVPQTELIQIMYRAESEAPDDRANGAPLKRLETYMRSTQQQLGASGALVQPAGDGYRFVA